MCENPAAEIVPDHTINRAPVPPEPAHPEVAPAPLPRYPEGYRPEILDAVLDH